MTKGVDGVVGVVVGELSMEDMPVNVESVSVGEIGTDGEGNSIVDVWK